jgi:glycosyltransferase involved in cell wall biosynthesis
MSSPLRVLLEMRPAFDGHAGIPQEARLLFRGLNLIGDLRVEGLLQSSGHVLLRGLPAKPSSWSREMRRDKQLNRLSRVVVSVKKDLFNVRVAAIEMALWHLLGGSQALTRFDATHFRDFIWQSLFARTLHAEDFDTVTNAGYRIARVPWTAMHRCGLATHKLGYPLYPRLDTSAFDIMIAETPYPATVSPRTRLVVRYHDAIPLLMPHTIAQMEYHQASHYHALRCNVAAGARFACVSDSTRKDLVSIFPRAEAQSVTIHNMVSQHYFPEDSTPERIAEIVRTRLNEKIAPPTPPATLFRRRDGNGTSGAVNYLLMVSTIEPRKNHAALLAAWEGLRAGRFPDMKLVIVGMLGWSHKPIVKKFRPWMERGELVVLEDVPSPELRLLYGHSRATICPSFGEGFDFSGVEAMRCGTAVIASDIPVHREIFDDAAEYCSPYDTADLARAIAEVADPSKPARRDELVRKGAAVSARYLPEVILPKWREYLLEMPASASRP